MQRIAKQAHQLWFKHRCILLLCRPAKQAHQLNRSVWDENSRVPSSSFMGSMQTTESVSPKFSTLISNVFTFWCHIHDVHNTFAVLISRTPMQASTTLPRWPRLWTLKALWKDGTSWNILGFPHRSRRLMPPATQSSGDAAAFILLYAQRNCLTLYIVNSNWIQSHQECSGWPSQQWFDIILTL